MVLVDDSAWESIVRLIQTGLRARAAGNEGEALQMTHPPSASSGQRLPFAFAGQVTVWDPIHRHLEIGPLTCRIVPGVSVDRLATGVRVTVMGYVERPVDSRARWIVTQFTLI